MWSPLSLQTRLPCLPLENKSDEREAEEIYVQTHNTNTQRLPVTDLERYLPHLFTSLSLTHTHNHTKITDISDCTRRIHTYKHVHPCGHLFIIATQ